MANRNYASQKMFTGHVMPVLLDGRASIGASGAPSNLIGPYIKSIDRLGAGLYQIQAQDNYSGVFSACAQCQVAETGAALDPNLGVVGDAYIITVVGDTDWATAGVPEGVEPAIGLGFGLAAAPAAGTGRVKAVAQSGIMAIEIVGDPNLESDPMLDNGPAAGAIVLLQCYDSAGAPADPADGSTLRFQIYLSNSSVQIGGE